MASERTDAVLRVDRLQKTFRIGFFRKRIDAVRDASFSVRRGEIFGLIGPNGAGKTTTIRMLMGLIRPDAGTASILGESIRSNRARASVGFLPETPHFYDYLKPQELLAYFGDLYGLDGATKKRRIPELLDRVGLSHATDKPCRKFSKGMLQRLGLAQALLADADFLLLDEPQSGLDPIGRKEVRDLIVEQRDKGKTVLFSSHVLSDVEEVCDRVAIMVQGRTTRVGTLADIVDSTIQEVEILLRPGREDADAEALAGYASRDNPGGTITLTVAEGEVDAALSTALAAGWSVQSVSPHRAHLEDVFLAEAGQGEGGER